MFVLTKYLYSSFSYEYFSENMFGQTVTTGLKNTKVQNYPTTEIIVTVGFDLKSSTNDASQRLNSFVTQIVLYLLKLLFCL